MIPSVTIITCCLNPDLAFWKKSLEAVRMQDYPRGLVNHVVMDGGSDERVIGFASRHPLRIISMPEFRENAMARMAKGIQMARGDILLFYEPDNNMVGRQWLSKMTKPFADNPEIAGSFSMRNTSLPSMPALTRYLMGLGVNDPTVYYLGKSEKLACFEKSYNRGTVLGENAAYTTVRFERRTLPTLGDNGHMVRSALIKPAVFDPERFIHVDAYMQLLKDGHDVYAAVDAPLIHFVGSDPFRMYQRRICYKNRYYSRNSNERQYMVYDPGSSEDRRKLAAFVIASVTFIEPFIVSLRGFFVARDAAWFLHPLVCFLAVLSYTRSEIDNLFRRYAHR